MYIYYPQGIVFTIADITSQVYNKPNTPYCTCEAIIAICVMLLIMKYETLNYLRFRCNVTYNFTTF